VLSRKELATLALFEGAEELDPDLLTRAMKEESEALLLFVRIDAFMHLCSFAFIFFVRVCDQVLA
jgi:hypothetical protein